MSSLKQSHEVCVDFRKARGQAHETNIGSFGNRRDIWHRHDGRAGAGARPRAGIGIRSRRRRIDGRRDRGNESLLLWPGLLLRAGSGLLLRSGTLRLLRRAVLLSAPLLASSLLLVMEKPGSDASGLSFSLCLFSLYTPSPSSRRSSASSTRAARG